ncbi:MAG: hypothetical protein IPG25_14415, partial [Proteobacteria bacterium]|nr:hypothetical protein [Pseudomonadota bacterium]
GWEEEGWNIPATVAELRAEFEGWHPHVTAIIDGVPEDKLFKWALCARSAADALGQGALRCWATRHTPCYLILGKVP